MSPTMKPVVIRDSTRTVDAKNRSIEYRQIRTRYTQLGGRF